ncbi:ergothioneine biosynthesis glutamate--cysteine ligase EgtA [uncultured Jatrophihabitans sp.]|uniref:ergothioneine biosynthesis glutamate--cysteine ligase EgtA n=1 Tax=uncultured Jatrophihabitans sp. TaxID=1610747 RepID=UPI0035CC20D4
MNAPHAPVSPGAASSPDADELDCALADPRRAVTAAREHIATTALQETASDAQGLVGLELELHVVDLARPAQRPTWTRLTTVAAGLPAMPGGSAVTFEPGGQIELSTPPTVGIVDSVAALRADARVLQAALAQAGLGAAPLGADPARPVRRVNPSLRYAAMEQHFAALGCATPGRAMMSATAALQVNLDAGPRAGWGPRLELIRRLGPVLTALAACSPYLAGDASGWRSMRQQAWHGIDSARSDPVSGADPAAAWATYALQAPVMLVLSADGAVAITSRVPLAAWLDGSAPIPRRPTLADIDYHLTTLFPPVRPRGYVEIRYLDAAPHRWWPAVATITATLIDDPVAADRAAEVVEPVGDARAVAARDGLADQALRAAAESCVAVAADRCPAEGRAEVEAYAELVFAGRTPGDELRERAERHGPLAVLAEEARA